MVIVAPPWPRGGTARVIENQVEFYRSRGFTTAIVCVPYHCAFVEAHPGWEEIKTGIGELGADRTFFAAIDERRFRTAKYTAWVKQGFRGTALDWIVFTAGAVQLPREATRFLDEARVALVHANHVFTVGFAERLIGQVSRSGARVPMILETHDIQALALEDKGEINPWTHSVDSREQLIRSELSYLKKRKVLVHCSVDDFDFFKKRLPDTRHVLAMPTIDETFVSGVGDPGESSTGAVDLLFVGQSTHPNLAAMKWFFDEVWPLVVDRGYSIKIVGQIDMLVRKDLPEIYNAHRSSFVGPVAELASYYRAARCVIAPMVSGTGISVKTIEALALGKPFVGTRKAYRGMPIDRISEAGLEAADTPHEFANAIVRTLGHEQRAGEISRSAYDLLFSKLAAFKSRDEALRLLTVT